VNEIYSARYQDRFGEEATMISNDGTTLTMVVRGIQFHGNDFDSFEPSDTPDPARLSSFSCLHGSLCHCMIEADIPVPVVTPSGIVDGLLTFQLELGQPSPTGQMDLERLKLRLAVNQQSFCSQGNTGWFEEEMLDIQSQLPTGTLMKVCFNCAFSDYSPYGHGLFGNMICFRANNTGYLTMPSGEDFDKHAYFHVMETVSEMVQETYLCPEFERCAPGTGYRG
jgi:Family of unknown function (DUF6304)